MEQQNTKELKSKLMKVLRIGEYYSLFSFITAIITWGLYLLSYPVLTGDGYDCFLLVMVASIISFAITVLMMKKVTYDNNKSDTILFRRVSSGNPFKITFSLFRSSICIGYIAFIYCMDHGWRIFFLMLIGIVEGYSYRLWLSFEDNILKDIQDMTNGEGKQS